MITRATYCTREDVLSVLQVLQTPRAYPQVDRAIVSATDNVERRCHRVFHPSTATKDYTWPDPNSTARSWRVWLDGNDLLDVTTLTSGGTTIPSSDYLLEPQQYGPPYNRLEINLSGSSGFSAGSTTQRAIVINGTWGYTNATTAATTLASSATAAATTLTVADGSQVGIGDLLTIGTERLIVTGRAAVSTGQTLATPMTASNANVSLAVADGTAIHVGETLTLDTEQMYVVDVVANTATVERAVNSTVLATHTGSTVYAPRTLSVTRAANGSTAASHSSADVVYKAVVPGPVFSLALGEALVEVQQLAAAYARMAGSGDNSRVIGAGPGLNDLRAQVYDGYARKVKMRAV